MFGEIVNSGMKLSSHGEIVQKEWFDIPNRFPNIQLDSFIVMPNHIHGIINVGVILVVTLDNVINENNRAGTSHAPTLGDIIGSFKSLCIYKCRNNGLNAGKLWQRNYYEHIVRNEAELNKTREYIINNPLNWHDDENYMPNWQKEI